MRTPWILLLVIGCYVIPVQAKEESMMSSFNPELARELGADQYGMAHYVIAFLKRGPNRDKPRDEAEKLQRAHLDNIHRLAAEGKLLVSGPFLDDGDLRGIYIFDVDTVEEARALAESDPSVQAGWLELEFRPWYGSAALRKLAEIAAQITEKQI